MSSGLREPATSGSMWHMEQTNDMLTTGEVARLLGVKPRTVGRWVRQGKLTPVRLPSGRSRFPRATVEAMIPAPTDA